MQHTVDVDLRMTALAEANKAYKTSSMSVSGGGGGGSLPTAEVVERAQAYYNFLKGTNNG